MRQRASESLPRAFVPRKPASRIDAAYLAVLSRAWQPESGYDRGSRGAAFARPPHPRLESHMSGGLMSVSSIVLVSMLSGGALADDNGGSKSPPPDLTALLNSIPEIKNE